MDSLFLLMTTLSLIVLLDKGALMYEVKDCNMDVRSTTISVVELQGNSDSGRERLRLPTASLTIVFIGGMRD